MALARTLPPQSVNKSLREMEGQLTKLMLRIENRIDAATEKDEERAAEREAMEVMTQVLARNMQTPGKGAGPMAGSNPTNHSTEATDPTDPTDPMGKAMKTPGGLMHSAGGSII